MSQPLGRPIVQTLNPVRNVLAVKRSTALISQQRAQQERPASLQLGIELTIQPGITIQEINDLGRAEQDLFLWEAHQRPAMLTVTSQGAHYDWRNLPLGWNNPQWHFAPPVQIGQFRPGQPAAVRGSVAGMTTAQKVMEAMFRSLKSDLPEGVAAIIKDMMQPENIAKIVLVQTLYAGSMFIGVGEVATLVMVAAGFYFVGQEVLAFIDGLKAFVETVTKAQTEQDLDQAAVHFKNVVVSGVNIAKALFTRRGGTHQPNSVLCMRAHGGSGGGKKPAGGGSGGTGSSPTTASSSSGSPPGSKPKGGASRASIYGGNWPKGSLKDAIDKFAPGAKGVPNAKGDKIIYKGPDGKQVVYDPAGNYYRIEDTTLPGKRRYLDMDGNVPNNKVENGKQKGRSQDEYNEVTHYSNTD